LDNGQIILCDRYTDATIAYQGYARGLDIAVINQMNHWATGGLTPHCTIVLDCPVEVGMARAKGEDRFEREDKKFHQQVREGYLRIARQDPRRVKVVSGQGEQSAIQGEIQRIIRPLLDRR
jgi:dTMP kinase